MGTIVVTGVAGGIGAATASRLVSTGHRVIGVDLRDADVVADLATADGRAAMVEGVTEAAGGVLDGVVAAAGVNGKPGELVVSVNYFGAVATLEGLRPLLARGRNASAVAVCSNSATTQPGVPESLVTACLDGDEAEARRLGADDPQGLASYAASKLALARWLRRAAVDPDWVGEGIRLNAIAPGFIQTPMTRDIEDMIFGLGDIYPMPLGRAGTAAEVAALLTFLLSPDAAFFCGSVVVMDGGTEAALRPDIA
ncbi:MAG TPA: SDR family oxidoreductase [Acidimicrobiales bacterium]|nr:SDR family oxidoreductase [Acidimicrobiales bacterium]